MRIVEHLEPTEGEEGQWLGVYMTRWQREWGQPTEMFRDVELGDVPEVKALVEAAIRICTNPTPCACAGMKTWYEVSASDLGVLKDAAEALQESPDAD